MPRSIRLPSDITNPIIMADWLELMALTTADGNSSHGDLQRALNRLGVANYDSICTDTMQEFHRRVAATGDNYPFTFSGTLLATRGSWQDYASYVFCLLLSYCEDEDKQCRGLQHVRMFEMLSCIAARNYIDGEVLRFGSPRQRPIPDGFRDALIYVCGKVEEWTPTTRRILSRKDGGLDLVAWKHFPDHLSGKLILFGHCASGRNWDTKITELQPNDFCNLWLSNGSSPIVKTFFIPHRLSSEIFEHLAVSAKLFFDRCRIARWAPSIDFRRETREQCVRWCRNLLRRVLS